MKSRIQIASFAIFLLASCDTPKKPISPPAPEKPLPPAVVIHLPGIAGEIGADRRLAAGLVKGGVATKVTIFDWTGKNRGLLALGTQADNDTQAKKLAGQITAIYRADPRTRIIITAHSGGTGVAIWALEALPADVKIDRLLLLASALSPTYDLSNALAHVRGQAISLYSQYDSDVLGYGTRVFGTFDRLHVDAAGYVGFRTDVGDPQKYARLMQIPYDRAWIKLGNAGDHMGTMDDQFAEEILSPLLK